MRKTFLTYYYCSLKRIQPHSKGKYCSIFSTFSKLISASNNEGQQHFSVYLMRTWYVTAINIYETQLHGLFYKVKDVLFS